MHLFSCTHPNIHACARRDPWQATNQLHMLFSLLLSQSIPRGVLSRARPWGGSRETSMATGRVVAMTHSMHGQLTFFSLERAATTKAASWLVPSANND